MCGTKIVLLVLAEFPEYKHLSSRAEISHLFFGQVARYFAEVSYGKLMMNGNATDWITLPKLYEQYRAPGQGMELASIAADSFSAASQTFNFTSFDYVFLVLSFYPSLTADYIQLPKPIATGTGSVAGFAVVEEDRDWSSYARAFALMIGLWSHRNQLLGLGELDIASSGQGDMSVWSKLILGWINSSQVLTFSVPSVRRIFTVSPVGMPQAQTLAARIELGRSKDEYLIEVRQPLGYDRSKLQEFGVVVLYIPPGNSSIEFRTVLQPDNVGRGIFLDLSVDLSIVVLNQTQIGFRVLVGNVEDGRDAQRTLYATSRALDAFRIAEEQNRIDGLDFARKLVENSRSLFAQGRFDEAQALAISAETSANSALVPGDYYQSAQLISRAEDLRNETRNLLSSESAELVGLGSAQLDIAEQAFASKNFTLARQSAEAAIDLFNRAEQVELIERVLDVLSNVGVVIAVAVLAYALRYQLKSS